VPRRGLIDGQHHETEEEASSRVDLGLPQASYDLLDVDRGGRSHVAAEVDGPDPIDGGPAAEVVDQHRGIENDEHGSAGAAPVGVSLLSHPAGGVVIPVVPVVLDAAGRRLQVGAAELLLNRPFDGGPHERSPASRPAERIDACEKLVVELYVHSHGPILAHRAIARLLWPMLTVS
jgi:hypothetical protein